MITPNGKNYHTSHKHLIINLIAHFRPEIGPAKLIKQLTIILYPKEEIINNSRPPITIPKTYQKIKLKNSTSIFIVKNNRICSRKCGGSFKIKIKYRRMKKRGKYRWSQSLEIMGTSNQVTYQVKQFKNLLTPRPPPLQTQFTNQKTYKQKSKSCENSTRTIIGDLSITFLG